MGLNIVNINVFFIQRLQTFLFFFSFLTFLNIFERFYIYEINQ